MRKITIVYDDKISEFEFNDMEFSLERGIAKFPDGSTGNMVFVPNGQQRLTIKAWKGCSSFDSFSTEVGQ